jgi:hypothetical protein
LTLGKAGRNHDEELGTLAQLIVRNLENAVKVRLQRRAKRHGRSMEEEALRFPIVKLAV